MSSALRYGTIACVVLLIVLGTYFLIDSEADPPSDPKEGQAQIPMASRSPDVHGEPLGETEETSQEPILLHQTELKREGGLPALEDVAFRFYGNSQLSDEEILAGLRIPKSPYFSDLENAIRKHVHDAYGERGYAQALVKHISAQGNSPTIVSVEISEGEIYYFNELTLDGTNRYSDDEIASFYPQKGEVANWTKLQLANARLKDKYARDGYLDAKVENSAKSSKWKQSLDYKVDVTEGPQYRVGRVTLPKELLMDFPLSRGQVFRPHLLTTFLTEQGVPPDSVQVERLPDESVVEIFFIG
jgi:outer membrane protein assembly factor BamA